MLTRLPAADMMMEGWTEKEEIGMTTIIIDGATQSVYTGSRATKTEIKEHQNENNQGQH